MTQSTEPKRIQRKRTKGWRMPEGAVYVGRGSKWGNPFTVGEGEVHDRERAVQWFANWLSNTVVGGMGCDGRPDYQGAPFANRPSAQEIREALSGCDLACWCPLDQPCHADVLLAIANERAEVSR